MVDIEVAWLEKAKKGDADAFGNLVETFQVPVYNLCYRMLGDPYEAEDAAQETFLRAYNGISRYDSSRSFSTWLLSIAAHYCIDQIRRRRMVVIPFELLPYQDVQDPTPNPETRLGQSEDQRQIHALLELLNPTDRAIAVMYYWNDLSYEQIAEILHLTISAVKSRLHRSRAEMAKRWNQRDLIDSAVGRKKHESPTF